MQQANEYADATLTLLAALFLASGVSALIYQVAWQRILFVAFGVDLESVTIVVAAFMLGLGLGALLGGMAADTWPEQSLNLFALAEMGIGLFGLFSPNLLLWAGMHFSGLSLPGMAAVNFLLVLFPTLLMGATLPILITYVAKLWQHVGRATAYLYAINTLGASLGSLGVGFWLFNFMTVNEVVYLAASINLTVAGLGFWRFRKGNLVN